MPKVSDAHRAGRRRQILDGARRAFARYGYEGATVARLETEIDLSRGAIFNYFPSKWALFYALAGEDQDRYARTWLEEGFGAALRSMSEENPDWLGVYFELMGMLRTDPKLREEWSKRSPEAARGLTELLEDQQRRGELRADLSVEAIGSFMGLILDGAVLHLCAGYPVDSDSVLRLVNSAVAPQ